MCVTTDLAEKHLKDNYDISVIRADLIKTIAIIKALEEQLRLYGVSITLPLKYNDHIAEIEGQAHTLSYCPNLDDYTDITEAFKRGMKKQVELINKGN